jgi:hypothetical protein
MSLIRFFVYAQLIQINLYRSSRGVIILFFIFLACFHTYGQRNAPIPADLLINKAPVDEIVTYRYLYEGQIFWTRDFQDRRFEYLVKAGNSLHYLLDGTGRVYRVNRDGEFIRIDSTKLTGYNFGAYTFNYRDTIYSLGGYGFWRYNGHLRYFSPSYTHEWEIKLLNKELPIVGNLTQVGWSLWLDKMRGNIIYSEQLISQDMNTKIVPADTCKVWKLDINTKQWSVLGTLHKEVSLLLGNNVRIISLPWGELFLSPKIRPRLTLMDYHSNQLKELDVKKSTSIRSFIHDADKDNSRVFIYTRDSTLTFHISEKRKLVLSLSGKDFRAVGQTIFEPYQKPISIYGIQGVSLGAMVGGLFLFMVSLWMFYGSYQLTIKSKKAHALPYDSNEATLIRAMISHPEHTLTADEVNVLLGTSKKSLDVQRKNRSEIIVSINKKYQAISGQSDLLITQKRADNDKRLVNYFINLEKHQQVKEALPPEH